MSRQSWTVAAAAAASIVALLVGFWALRSNPSATARRASSAAPAGSVTLPEPPSAAVVEATSTARAAPIAPLMTASEVSLLDEPALMQKLRELRSSDPSLSLQLARRANERFKDSPGAAERSWFIVKALTELGRHDEARIEGHRLLDQYHDTRWAKDVYRHLFVNPGTHPFERGYGKQLESDP